MTKKQAIKVLAEHNAWRRGVGMEMQHPTKIGIAIETAIRLLSAPAKRRAKK